MADKLTVGQQQLWLRRYNSLRTRLLQMVMEAPTHGEARRRCAIIRLEIATAESALDLLDRLGVSKEGFDLEQLAKSRDGK